MQEIDQLRELGKEIAAAESDHREPRCISRAFSRLSRGEIALTMQGWIELDAMNSPLLHGELPDQIEDTERAAELFGLDLSGLDANEAAEAGMVMARACMDAFALCLRLAPPEKAMARDDEGFGTWLPLYSFLVVQCAIHPDTVAGFRVDRAFALLAVHRHNQGWKIVSGMPYKLRDLGMNPPAPTTEDAANV